MEINIVFMKELTVSLLSYIGLSAEEEWYGKLENIQNRKKANKMIVVFKEEGRLSNPN